MESQLVTLGLKNAVKEEIGSKVWLGENKNRRQEQSTWGPVGQRVYEERQQRCDLTCSDEKGKEQLGKEPRNYGLRKSRVLTRLLWKADTSQGSMEKQKTGMGWRESLK